MSDLVVFDESATLMSFPKEISLMPEFDLKQNKPGTMKSFQDRKKKLVGDYGVCLLWQQHKHEPEPGAAPVVLNYIFLF